MREQQSSDADYSEITDAQRFHAGNDPERVGDHGQALLIHSLISCLQDKPIELIRDRHNEYLD